MLLFKYLPFLLVLLTMIACAGVKTVEYKDTSELEKPPEMEIAVKPKPPVEEKQEIKGTDTDIDTDTGLGDIVSLAEADDKSVIKIKKTFDRSWELVEQAIKLNEIEVTDKNREKGVFYVLFDPDDQSSEETKESSFSFFGGEYEEGAYKINVAWHENNTEVSAELLSDSQEELLDDAEDIEDFEGTVAADDHLIKTLYKTLRHDLPLK